MLLQNVVADPLPNMVVWYRSYSIPGTAPRSPPLAMSGNHSATSGGVQL